MTFLMCSTFLLAWTPYGIFAVWETFHGPQYVTSPLFSAIPAMFAKGVSVNNPMFHFFFNRKFRMQAVKLFTRSNRVMVAPDPPMIAKPTSGPPPAINCVHIIPGTAAAESRPSNHRSGDEFSKIASGEDSLVSVPVPKILTLNVKQLVPRPPTITSSS